MIDLDDALKASVGSCKDVRRGILTVDRFAAVFENVGSWPLLRVASEYPDPEHPFHRSIREHKAKLLAYLSELIGTQPNDRQSLADELVMLIDGALSVRLVYGTSRRASSIVRRNNYQNVG